MAVNLATKRVPPIFDLQLKNADGSPMLDEENNPAFVRVHTLASKTYEVAQTALRRKSLKRVRENGGKMEAVADDRDDKTDFLVAVTEEFVNVALDGVGTGAKALATAIYKDPELGFIRDQVEAAYSDWGSFTDGSATN